MIHLVTGGSGFLGAALVHDLVEQGRQVRVLDDNSRGRSRRIEDLDIEFVGGDVRDPEVVHRATEGVDTVWHLAYINGTRFFYERPDDVLEVGIKGALNTIEAALAHEADIAMILNQKATATSPNHLEFDLTQLQEAKNRVVLTIEKNRRGQSDVHLEFKKDFGNFRLDPAGAFVAEALRGD